MIRRTLAAACCLLVVGCGAAPAASAPVTTPATISTFVPADAVTLVSLGFTYAPADFYVPASAVLVESVNQSNNVVAVFSAPAGADLAAFLRSNLPAQGWTITADGNDSLLFDRGQLGGAFTVTGGLAALTIRSDPSS